MPDKDRKKGQAWGTAGCRWCLQEGGEEEKLEGQQQQRLGEEGEEKREEGAGEEMEVGGRGKDIWSGAHACEALSSPQPFQDRGGVFMSTSFLICSR